MKGSISGKGIQVPLFWLSIEELRQNMAGILVSCLRGKTFSAELIRNGVLSEGRLVIVVGDGFGLEIQIFDLRFLCALCACVVSQLFRKTFKPSEQDNGGKLCHS